MLENLFPALGIRFISVTDHYDSYETDGSASSLLIPLKNLINSFYSKDISRKVSSAVHARQLAAMHIPSMIPYGYIKSTTKEYRFEPDPEIASVVKRIFQMRIDGVPINQIATRLQDEGIPSPGKLRYIRGQSTDRTYINARWSAQGIKQILQNPTYLGHLVFGRMPTALYKSIDNPTSTMRDESEWIITPNRHEAIVSVEEFHEAQKAILTCGKFERKTNNYLLRSLIRCDVCGRIMSRSRQGAHSPVFYKCDKNRYIENSPCPIGEHFYEKDLEKIVLASLSQLLQTIVDNDRQVRQAAAKTNGTADSINLALLAIDQKLKRCQAQKLDAYEKYSEGNISRESFIKEQATLTSEAERLMVEKESLKNQYSILERSRTSALHEITQDAENFLSAESITNDMLLTYIDRVLVYTGDRVEIKYRFNNPFAEIAE